MKPGPVLAVDLLHTVVGITDGPVPVSECLIKLILQQGWARDVPEAEEYAQRWTPQVISQLEQVLSDHNRLGRPIFVTFNPSSPDHIQGAAFVAPNDPPEVVEVKSKRLLAHQYHQILKQLTPSEFETLCGKVMEKLGVRNVTVTPRSGDEGIDFYGQLHLEDFLHSSKGLPTIERQMHVWIIGQAKRYIETLVSPEDIRDLVGAVQLARGEAYASEVTSKYPDLRLRVCDPIYCVFVTTGHITANTWRLIDRSGVIAMDGAMLAQFVAENDLAKLGAQVDPEGFRQWLVA